jgi:hypothetical protein
MPKISDKQLICYVGIHTDDPQQFGLRVELTLRQEYWIRFSM